MKLVLILFAILTSICSAEEFKPLKYLEAHFFDQIAKHSRPVDTSHLTHEQIYQEILEKRNILDMLLAEVNADKNDKYFYWGTAAVIAGGGIGGSGALLNRQAHEISQTLRGEIKELFVDSSDNTVLIEKVDEFVKAETLNIDELETFLRELETRKGVVSLGFTKELEHLRQKKINVADFPEVSEKIQVELQTIRERLTSKKGSIVRLLLHTGRASKRFAIIAGTVFASVLALKYIIDGATQRSSSTGMKRAPYEIAYFRQMIKKLKYDLRLLERAYGATY